jgi:hypothetical protein
MLELPTSVALVGAVALAGQVAWGQEPPIFARLQPGNTVEVLDLKKQSWRRIYRSPSWGTSGLSVAPSGDRLALLAWKEGIVSGHDYTVPPASELVIIDTAGRTLGSVARVQRYAWCGPACIVYITGQYEESHFGFRPESMGVLNIASGDKTAVPAPPYPIGVTWARFDSAVYVKNRPREGEARIYRIDLRTRTVAPTVFRDHLFSPSGRYYLHRPDLTDTLALYDTRTNAAVDISRLRRDAIPIGWTPSGQDILLTVRREHVLTSSRERRVRPTPRNPGDKPVVHTYELYHVPDGRMIKRMTGQLGDYAAPNNLRLVELGGAYQIVDTQRGGPAADLDPAADPAVDLQRLQ